MSVINLYRQDNQPFAQIPNQAIRDPKITPNAFRLLAYLMSHQDGYALSYEQIERQTTLGRYAINQAAKLLEQLGWIVVDRPKINGQFVAKTWTVLNPTNANESTADDSTMESPHMGQSTDIRRTLNKEYKDIKNTKKAIDDENYFDSFWEIYPRKQSKPMALKAYEKALKTTPAIIILNAAYAYAHDPNRDPQFTKLPATWLNQECWNDDPLPARTLDTKATRSQQAKTNFLQLTEPTNEIPDWMQIE